MGMKKLWGYSGCGCTGDIHTDNEAINDMTTRLIGKHPVGITWPPCNFLNCIMDGPIIIEINGRRYDVCSSHIFATPEQMMCITVKEIK